MSLAPPAATKGIPVGPLRDLSTASRAEGVARENAEIARHTPPPSLLGGVTILHQCRITRSTEQVRWGRQRTNGGRAIAIVAQANQIQNQPIFLSSIFLSFLFARQRSLQCSRFGLVRRFGLVQRGRPRFAIHPTLARTAQTRTGSLPQRHQRTTQQRDQKQHDQHRAYRPSEQRGQVAAGADQSGSKLLFD